MASPPSPFAGDGSFDPESIEVMTKAFDDAWQSLQASGVKFDSGQVDAVRDMPAKCIVEMAKRGERDHRRLRDACLAHLAKKWGAPDGVPI
jgi:hypothetical protein